MAKKNSINNNKVNKYKIDQAIILCAGKSTRAWPLTITKPKPLLRVANKTLLEYNIEAIKDLTNEILIVVGYLKEQIVKYVEEKYPKLNIKFVEQKEQNGTGGALLEVKNYLKDRFIVINGDDIYSKGDIENCLKDRYSVLAKQVFDISNFGELIVDEKNKKIITIKEKPQEKRKGFANTGVYVLDKKIFDFDIALSERNEYEITDFIKKLSEKEVVNYNIADFWIPITYPWSLLNANEIILSNFKKSINKGIIEKGATLKGNIIIGQNTIVKSGSYLEGNIIIGDNCVIGPNCYIRGFSSIGNNCKIGNAVEVKNSIIGDKTSIGHLSYVGDSIIGNNVNFGAGTITANLRHDDSNVFSFVKGNLVDSGRRKLGAIIGDNVHTGIHTSIYPGRKIWPNKTTLPGEIVKKDIE
ncbi:MAG: sugar phosphate nucleotidyltransferase [Candidatus Woesearchaeota archaeon]